MKRKGKELNTIDNLDNQHPKKKQKTIEPSQDEVIEILERRRQELSELVSKENELYGSQNNKNAAATTSQQSTSCDVNYLSNESENDLNKEEKKKFEKFKIKEKQRTIATVEVVYKKQALNALKILETDAKKSKKNLTDEEKRLPYIKRRCNNQHYEHTWDSATYIMKNIRACILTRDWNNLTHLLLLLLKHNKSYVPFVKQVAHLNFMYNPSDSNRGILDEFYKLGMVSENIE
ncbi:hypothetical protein ILUMI_12439 [Ignelater luminosus]|uniref:Uncharacterized protein n=1 Tax=Ignelater luminosus TaxID=2038154 RepID=A0A8K0G6S7_IGNLU|nr:hypothetical protein ILUMI_12439 [Ignelater luminosus]